MTTPTRPDVQTPVPAHRLRLGLLAEYRHLLHDEDPDSTVPAIRISLTKPSRRTA
ncbi:hypothetical protein [Streptomyces sp. NBC_00932]|uniref:hypothetical protein n=1 Tax=Streptomyces sp. NBC_00932 TaxID=2903690 RepID=UPI00386BA9B5|nr:hypothetical protein OG221_27520 [Streptomyces sp. NBC_00932]